MRRDDEGPCYKEIRLYELYPSDHVPQGCRLHVCQYVDIKYGEYV
jgi:hypothetical protein